MDELLAFRRFPSEYPPRVAKTVAFVGPSGALLASSSGCSLGVMASPTTILRLMVLDARLILSADETGIVE